MFFKFKKFLYGIISISFVTSSIISTPINIFAENQSNQPTLKASSSINITVGKGNEFDFNSISDAIQSIKYIPTEEYPANILISKGLYEEPVTVNLPYINFINAYSDNPQDVIISFDKAADHENPEKKFGTQQSATVTIEENAIGFSAKNITIQNSYNLNQPKLGLDDGRKQTQAVALVTLSDKIVIDNCRLIGRQDTLYLKGSSKGKEIYGEVNQARVYLKNCFIEGTVDYIFGDAVAFFDKCTLNMAFYKNGGHYTAANTTLFNTGYVFNECTLTIDNLYNEFNGEDKKNIDLGRPWQGDNAYPNSGSHTVFINCKMPDYLKSEGFSVWNDNTVKRKIRYMEYGSKDENDELIDIKSKRPDWIYILNEEQVKNYSAYNVLRGDDDWNPSNAVYTKSPIYATGVTLDKYSINIPKGEKEKITAFVVPLNANDRNVKFYSSDEKIAAVDKEGNITAIEEGNAVIYAETSDSGFTVSADIKVLPSRTNIPSVSEINIKGQNDNPNTIYPNDTLKGEYLYSISSDMDIDCAKVRWFSVDSSGNEILLKEGRTESDRSYKVSYSDIDSKIKFVVYPETNTTYGEAGEPISFITNVVSTNGDYIPKTYLKEDFSNFYKQKYEELNSSDYPIDKSFKPKWRGNNDNAENIIPSWNIITDDGNDSIGGCSSTSSLLKYIPNSDETPWKDIIFEARMRFNPTSGGFSGNCYYNIYTSYDEETNSYYKLKIARGSNTNSLFLYLYKKSGPYGEEELLASDEKSLVNSVPQNLGEENPYFRIKQIIKDGKITISFTLEGTENPEPKAFFTASDLSPLNGGYVAFENYGKINTLLLDSVFVEELPKNSDGSEYITRGEFIDMLVSALNKKIEINIENSTTFSDVSDSSYYSDAVNIAYNNDIISGDDKGKFNPNSFITIQDMVSMTARALRVIGIINDNGNQNDENSIERFVDSSIVSEYAKKDFAALILNGVYEPIDGKLFPKQPASKQSAQRIINTVINLNS